MSKFKPTFQKRTPGIKMDYVSFSKEEYINFINMLLIDMIIIEKTPKDFDNATYYYSFHMIDGKKKLINIDIEDLDCRFRPQEATKDGLTKVKCSFFSDIQEPFIEALVKHEALLKQAVEKKFGTKKKIAGFIQTHRVEKDKEGIEHDIPLERNIGWLCFSSKDKLSKVPSDKSYYAGKIEFLENTNGQPRSIEYKQPKFDDIFKKWPQRAFISCNIQIDNICSLKETINITLGISSMRTIIVQPIASAKNEKDEKLREKKLKALEENNIIITYEEDEENVEPPVKQTKDTNTIFTSEEININ